MGAGAGLRIRISTAVLVGALLVAAGVAQLLRNTVELRAATDATTRADQYLLQVVRIESLVVDAETGLRGYVATGAPLFLQPLHSAQTALPTAYKALTETAVANRSFRPEVNRLIASASAYMQTYLPSVLKLAARNLDAARSVALTEAGKREVDSIRAQTAALERMVSARQDARQRAARRTAGQSITEAIIVLVLLTGLTLLLGTFLGRLAVQRERARERAATTTRTLQESLLPAQLPSVPGCDLAVRFRPEGGGLVGGDFYDVYEQVPGKWMVVVGDVCGKGAAAAAVSAMARWTLRSLIGAELSPEAALQFLNEAMFRQRLNDRYLTLACLSVVAEPEAARVRVACAGHPPPLVVPAGGAPSVLEASGDLLGVWSQVAVNGTELWLRPGDCIVVYTDGVTDQGPGESVVPERALDVRPEGFTAEQLARRLEQAALASSTEQRDDIAIVALRFLGCPEPALAQDAQVESFARGA